MLSFFSRLRKRLRAMLPRALALVPYEVGCPCGYRLHGSRQPSYQAPKCPDCGRSVFVLPLSPLPPVAPLSELQPAALPSLRLPNRTRRPLLAARFALAFVSLTLLGLILLRIGRNVPADASELMDGLELLREHVRSGRVGLADGNFQLAAQEFHDAAAIRDRHPSLLSAHENRELMQLHRQATLLADLLTQSLEEILRRLDGLPEREGQAVLARHYRGKAVVFYTQVRRDAGGAYHMDYRLFDGRQEARLELGDLQLLRSLPLRNPHQILFGARLAGVRREAVGGWVVSLRPDSGVLLTDPGAAAACCFQPLEDRRFQEVLTRQAAWLVEVH